MIRHSAGPRYHPTYQQQLGITADHSSKKTAEYLAPLWRLPTSQQCHKAGQIPDSEHQRLRHAIERPDDLLHSRPDSSQLLDSFCNLHIIDSKSVCNPWSSNCLVHRDRDKPMARNVDNIMGKEKESCSLQLFCYAIWLNKCFISYANAIDGIAAVVGRLL
ncbi:hypothetical protein T11_1673 [Trichinella zimbabwensis]|uniref:Uncharacterized protein n=1 Tax=Trichinella zimbabwensis TaxID=268475 RepID=A0A0V1H274_9BILA|nr:hypothetical protein T11_1673 [Trichinella zimbabwensis]